MRAIIVKVLVEALIISLELVAIIVAVHGECDGIWILDLFISEDKIHCITEMPRILFTKDANALVRKPAGARVAQVDVHVIISLMDG